MKRKLYLLIALLVVAAITGVTFAQITGTTSIGVSTAGVAGDFVNVKTASAAGFSNLHYENNPSWSPIENAAGNITAGDVYYIDSTAYTGDMLVTLYLTNVPELGGNYSYLNQQFNVYTKRATLGTVDSASAETVSLGVETDVSTESVTIASGLAQKPVKFHSETIVHGSVTLARGIDYTIAYDSGTITLKTGGYYTASGNFPATVTASYTYYNTSGTRNAGLLVNIPVRAGSETITSGVTTLVRGTDYTIAYDSGTIILATGGQYATSASFPATVSVTYGYYTYASETVIAIGGETLAAGGAAGVTIAQGSTKTLANKPVITETIKNGATPLVRETVIAGESLAAAGVTIAQGSTKTLANKPVKADSEAINNGDTLLVKTVDYSIVYDTGVITFLKAITVLANTSLTAGYTHINYSIDYDTGVITFLKAITVAANTSLTAGYTHYDWAQATLADGTAIGTVYLTLSNGYVSFILAGNAYYDITIDDGTFNCIDTMDNATHDLAPSYYIDVRQA